MSATLSSQVNRLYSINGGHVPDVVGYRNHAAFYQAHEKKKSPHCKCIIETLEWESEMEHSAFCGKRS